MYGNLKILLLTLTLALILAPSISFACSRVDKQVFETQANDKTVIKQSFANMQSACDSGDCKDECCLPTSHNCQSEGCSGNCSGNLCSSAQYTLLADSKFLEDSKNDAFAYNDTNSNFFYQNSAYSSGFHTIWQPPKIG